MDVIGEIPDEIWNLTHLTYLKLDQNYLMGSLSPSIGNLTKLQFLSLGTNTISGTLPKELGQLSQLTLLGFGTNNFSGPLPYEIGNIAGLQQLYMDSSGVSGEIPSSFANLVNMQTIWASDNELNGNISEFIGTWTQLTDLRFEGNSLFGSIPSSAFSNLTSLQILRIGDLSNGSSSMTFIPKLTNLTTLDLSFNNIIGTIPVSLFTLPSLSYLFLGNNRLTGNLPSQIGPSLANIDVSYNQLSVSSFAIKDGGPTIKSSGGTIYEQESEVLGPATYYVQKDNRWVVSNAGYFLFSNNASYLAASTNTRQSSNTLDPGIYQTSRLSAGSLRYYGLGLENGNYTVLLHFAELVIQNGKTWKSLGRRVFDIYIQGHLALKNFDLHKEAGGSFLALQKNFTVQVKANYLEIHLLWVGKGTCCVPAQGTYGPSISGIKVTPNFVPMVSNVPPYEGYEREAEDCLAFGYNSSRGMHFPPLYGWLLYYSNE